MDIGPLVVFTSYLIYTSKIDWQEVADAAAVRMKFQEKQRAAQLVKAEEKQKAIDEENASK